ncbi:MAG: hypothetical protein JXB14_00320 [Candidatus Altiarchaeota archaeon]|nr:hypothetical protein [Candidatus Altiarchaeota archaeon]
MTKFKKPDYRCPSCKGLIRHEHIKGAFDSFKPSKRVKSKSICNIKLMVTCPHCQTINKMSELEKIK